MGNTAVLRLRHHTAQGSAASCWDTVFHLSVPGHVPACHQQYIIRTKMLLSGDVEENPGPSLRGMQWNCAGLSQGKRLALHKTLVDERIAFCLLSETRMTPGEAACFSVAGYQHHGIARNCKGGGVSILVREDQPVETGMAVVGRIEQVHATIHLTCGTALTVTSAYIPPKHTFTATDLDTLLTTDGAQLSSVQTLMHTRVGMGSREPTKYQG
ncbi:hypothetical protein, unlikely [Trypanosoma brucei gambiense DAL972]|uniref:Uncharacterized protein n=1 Tax=Trypanosoma brucei gambiense (strain MHOM/CI/86/DAL972) TaxID=679716 RepID=C9ZTY6_TRYB9|nr:hypothetical protein, unlikely [Trypanosoma brucei gambiense DAL972]CBH12872.1 hypothetical protein, unlikely [Trypanosoma brucei gambiense DAL972]|eukprot:XP_011775151.1 hypothetical protein, unlikely [Trypanosoma brucei gambiense DAL972]